MTIEDVIALSKAGFTSEQILQMSQVNQQPQVQQIQQPVMQPQVQQIQQPVMQPQVQQIQQPQVMQPEVQQPDPFKQLFEQMTGIKQAIQSSNIQNSQMQVAAPQTTDDILASIIQPTKPKEDK